MMNEKKQKVNYKDYLVYIGTYTDGDSEGIYLCRLDMSNGQLRQIGVARNVENPSYLAIDAERHRLFAVNEVSDFDGRVSGGVSAYAIQPGSGELSLINQTFSRGGAPCYLSIDQSGRYILVANYIGGNVTVISIDKRGALGETSAMVAHSGSGPHPRRQDVPHPHSVVLDPANRYAFVPDLGLDKVMQYRFDRDTGRLPPNRRPWIEVRPGSGPRHLVFHPSGKYAFVINELSSTITAFTYDPIAGTLETLQTVSTLPDGYSGTNITADLHLTANGNFLLGSNRGHDSIAFYTVDQETGWLTAIDLFGTRGRTPRGFAIDPTGTFVLVANQDSHSVVTFRIDWMERKLVPTGLKIQIPSPVCLKFLS